MDDILILGGPEHDGSECIFQGESEPKSDMSVFREETSSNGSEPSIVKIARHFLTKDGVDIFKNIENWNAGLQSSVDNFGDEIIGVVAARPEYGNGLTDCNPITDFNRGKEPTPMYGVEACSPKLLTNERMDAHSDLSSNTEYNIRKRCSSRKPVKLRGVSHSSTLVNQDRKWKVRLITEIVVGEDDMGDPAEAAEYLHELSQHGSESQ